MVPRGPSAAAAPSSGRRPLALAVLLFGLGTPGCVGRSQPDKDPAGSSDKKAQHPVAVGGKVAKTGHDDKAQPKQPESASGAGKQCPDGEVVVGGDCVQVCSAPLNHTRVERVLALPKQTWFLDGSRQVPFFTVGAKIELSCTPGHEGVKESWMLECTQKGWNDSTASCKPIHCDYPVDILGLWAPEGEPGPNRTLQLRCMEGYLPSGGAAEIPCRPQKSRNATANATEPQGRVGPVARCVPGVGDADAWRSSLRMSALFSAAGLLGTTMVVVLLASYDRARQVWES